jgi:hypothetical protein
MTEQLAIPGTEKRSRFRTADVQIAMLPLRSVHEESAALYAAVLKIRKSTFLYDGYGRFTGGEPRRVFRLGRFWHQVDGKRVSTLQLFEIAGAIP